MIDRLIYGKENTQKIVSVEHTGNHVVLFKEDENGTVSSETIKTPLWVLATQPFKEAKGWIKLKGNLDYKWGVQFSSIDEYYQTKNKLYKYEKEIYSVSDLKEQAMLNRGYTYFKGMKSHKEISTLSFDLETTGIKHDDDSKILLISNTFRRNDRIIRKLFCYDDFTSQSEMLLAWCDWVQEINPSIIIGHNIFNFDFKYLNFIARREGIDLPLGRDKSCLKIAKRESFFRVDGSREQAYNKVAIYGRECIDTLFLSLKYDVAKKYESYALKAIIREENLTVENRQFYDAGSIRDNYLIPEEWTKIKQYAEHDADDSLALFDLMIPAYFFMTVATPKSFQAMLESASGSQLNSIMVRSYLQEGHSIPKADSVSKYDGAISIGNPGIYSNCHKVDVASLYPSIMIEFEVFDEDKDPLGNLKTLVHYFTTERLKNKKLAKDTGEKYYDDLQGAFKIFINSMYGFLGTAGLNFNCPSAAAYITEKGREILNTSIKWAESKAFKVANCDTDSIMYCREDESHIEEDERAKLLADLNSYFPERIRFEDDGYFPRVIILKAKNYILYDGKKIKKKGSSLKSSTLEPKLKSFLSEIIEAIVYKTFNYEEIYNKYVLEILNIKDIKPWCSKKTISATTIESDRANETKIMDAVQNTEYGEGDKIYVYFKNDGTLGLAENFNSDYDTKKLLKKLYDATDRFETVLPVKDLFINYSLKRSQNSLELLLAF